ncbi:MAG: tetratricopeptide repeat protein [Ignavibacteriae bacterium]|nr:tetratricopeptide repeat protein [Ignavibacteriota bacterium]
MANQEEMIENNNEVGVAEELNYDGSNTTSSLQRNIKLILIGLGVVVVAITAIIFYNKSKETKEQEASVALSRVMVFIESGDNDKAFNGDPQKLVRGTPIVGLKTIVDEYGGTRNGEVAAVYAGNALLAKKKYAEAEEYFSKGLGSESKEVTVASNAGLAVCKESKNEYSGAAEQYEKAASMSNQPSVIGKYKLYAAMNYEKANNKEKSEKLYREIIQGESAEFVAEAKSGLTRLGMIIE